MVSKSAKEYSKHSEQTEFKAHIVSSLLPVLFIEIQFRRNNLISKGIYPPNILFLFNTSDSSWNGNRTKQNPKQDFMCTTTLLCQKQT